LEYLNLNKTLLVSVYMHPVIVHPLCFQVQVTSKMPIRPEERSIWVVPHLLNHQFLSCEVQQPKKDNVGSVSGLAPLLVFFGFLHFLSNFQWKAYLRTCEKSKYNSFWLLFRSSMLIAIFIKFCCLFWLCIYYFCDFPFFTNHFSLGSSFFINIHSKRSL